MDIDALCAAFRGIGPSLSGGKDVAATTDLDMVDAVQAVQGSTGARNIQLGLRFSS